MVCDTEGALLRTSICNRGTEPVSDGVTVTFYDGDPDTGGVELCTAATITVLDPTECELVECRWASPPTMEPGVDVTVVADSSGTEGECLEGNNRSVVPGVFCVGLE